MAEYIEREATCKDCLHVEVCEDKLFGSNHENCRHFINKTDVVEVRHGEWVITKKILHSNNPYLDDDYYLRVECSECDLCVQETRGGFGYPQPITTNYCPNCGAKMDGKGEGE